MMKVTNSVQFIILPLKYNEWWKKKKWNISTWCDVIVWQDHCNNIIYTTHTRVRTPHTIWILSIYLLNGLRYFTRTSSIHLIHFLLLPHTQIISILFYKNWFFKIIDFSNLSLPSHVLFTSVTPFRRFNKLDSSSVTQLLVVNAFFLIILIMIS